MVQEAGDRAKAMRRSWQVQARIDDLQFLQGKSTQAEFSHTLNSLIDAGRQVVAIAPIPSILQSMS